MPDQMPPRTVADERTTLLALLQYQRDSVVRKVLDVPHEDAVRPMVATGTSLLWLVQHLRRAELVWVLLRFAGQEGTIPSDALRAEETVEGSVDAYRQMWAEVDAIVAAEPDLEAPCRAIGDMPQVNLRWVLMHLLEETARHAGHADILREQLDGATGR